MKKAFRKAGRLALVWTAVLLLCVDTASAGRFFGRRRGDDYYCPPPPPCQAAAACCTAPSESAIIQAVKEKIDELSLGTDDPT